MRDIYHSVYLLRRTPGTPSCGERERRRVIHDILASLTVWLQRQTQSITTDEWLVWVRKDLMKQLFGWLAIGHWKPPKPFTMTSKDLKVGEEDHEPIPESIVGVSRGLSLGLALEVNLGIG